MFDANLRGLPLGHNFFAKVHHINDLNPLYHLGVRGGDILYCQKRITFDKETSSINVYFADNVRVQLDCSTEDLFEYFTSAFIVYEGNEDFTGFIDDESKAKAKQLMEELSN